MADQDVHERWMYCNLPNNPSQAFTRCEHKAYPTVQHRPLQHKSTRELVVKTRIKRVDRELENHVPEPTFLQRYFGGTKRTLALYLTVATLVLAVNITWFIRAQRLYGIKDGYGTISRARCTEAKRLNVWLHLLINVLSTLLLTGSGAFMSTYCCPSREEVDRAHAYKKWLHIGLLSLGNMRWISKKKSLVVLLLSVSSIPFHLLYNSLVFVSLSVNNYYYLVTTEGYLSGAHYNLTGPVLFAGGNSPYFSIPRTLPNGEDGWNAFLPYEMDTVTKLYEYFDQVQSNASKWERLDNTDCIQAYSNAFVSQRRNLILVSTYQNNSDSLLTYGSVTADKDSNWWICSLDGDAGGGVSQCQPPSYIEKATAWTVFDFPIDYCMSETIEDMCEVEFSLPIMMTVIVFNLIKVSAMLWIYLSFDASGLLTTVGDALISFIQEEDATTRGMCLADRQNITQLWQSAGFARPYNRHQKRWGSAVSKKRWFLYFLLIIFSFLLIAGFGFWGFSHVKNRGIDLDFKSLWSLGFGTVHQDTLALADNQSSTIGMAILANIPQLFLALVWLVYLGIMKSMFLAHDWSKFGQKSQYLMVSGPRGEQRGTWLLDAPLKYGIPLMILQILLHWFMSQSLFVVQMTAYNADGSVYHMPYSSEMMINLGYSPIAIIFCTIASLLLVLSSVLSMLRKFPKGSPPIVSSCSAAISAACHPWAKQNDMIYQRMVWAVVGFDGEVGHCSLLPETVSTVATQKPLTDHFYA